MFFVFNKNKIKSYLVSIGTVAVLLVLSVALQNNTTNQTIITSNAIGKMPLCRVNIEEKKVAITINCIENMNNISNILDTLSKTKAKATFFVTGTIVDKFPEEVKKIVSNGHELGNMSDQYMSLKKLSKSDVEKQIKSCNAKIETLTKVVPTIFRIPYGEYSNEILEIAQNNNMETIQWNIDSLDYNGLTAEEMCERIEENLVSGSIILLHNEYMDNNLEIIVKNIQDKGYEITNVSEIMYNKNYQINEKGEQIYVN